MIYYAKMPREQFSRPTCDYRRSLSAKKADIESTYAAGYTNEPFVQLVRFDGETHEVIGEFIPGKAAWIDPIEAAFGCGGDDQ